MNTAETFQSERARDIEAMSKDKELREKSIQWMIMADKYKYTYNFSWMGRPIIKFPVDMVVQQEIMWNLRPDLIIETGIAHGGSIIFSASMQKMMDIDGEVVGVDIDIRQHNRELIDAHPVRDRITMYEGSSTDPDIIEKVSRHAEGKKNVMVILDSLHSHSHVLSELKLYSPLVTVGSYLILPDTFIEFFPQGYYSKNRPWDKGDNPYTAMQEFLQINDHFSINKSLTHKSLITETIDGYLQRIR
jgi:cephalosporin hydroxylase